MGPSTGLIARVKIWQKSVQDAFFVCVCGEGKRSVDGVGSVTCLIYPWILCGFPKSPKFVTKVTKMTKKFIFSPAFRVSHWSLKLFQIYLLQHIDMLIAPLILSCSLICSWIFLSFSSSELPKLCDQSSQNGEKIHFLAPASGVFQKFWKTLEAGAKK